MTGEKDSSSMSTERCDRCGRFIGEDCSEGIDWAAGMQQNGDVAWTGLYYCANGVGCNRGSEDFNPFVAGERTAAA